MTSEIRANTLKNRVGLGTIEYSNTGPVISGVTTSNNFKTGSTNVHSVGVEAAGINVLGADTPIGTGATIYNSGAAVFTGVVTATSFSGTVKATNLTSDRVVFTTTNGQLEASGNLTYNGTTLASGSPVDINSDLDVDGHTNLDNVSIAGVATVYGTSSYDILQLRAQDNNGIANLNMYANGTTGHSRILFSDTAASSGDGWVNYSHTDRALTFTTAGTNNERLRIDSSGRVLIGTDSSLNQYGSQSHLQVAGTEYESSTIALRREQNNANPPGIVFAKSRSGTLGGNTIVQNNDQIGSLIFVAADGTDLTTVGAQIKVEVDGSPAHNNIPGRIVFQTGGTAASNERLRITSTGQLLHTANKSSGYTARFVQSHADNPAVIEIDSPSNNHLRPSSIKFMAGGVDKWGVGEVYNPTSQNSFHICTGSASQSTSKVTVTSDGTVGINNTDPSSTYKLDVSGAGRFTTSTSNQQNDFNTGQLTVRNTQSSQGAFIDFRAYSTNGTEGVIAKIGGFNVYSGTGYDGLLTFSTRQMSTNTMVERMRITKTGKVGINFAATPPAETFMIRPATDETVSRVTLSHISSGNSYGARISTVAGTTKGFELATVFNSTYVTRARMSDTGAFQLSPSDAISSTSNTFALNIATNYHSGNNPVYTGISLKNLENNGGDGMCIHTTSGNWDLYTNAGNEYGLSIARATNASSNNSRFYLTQGGNLTIGNAVNQRLSTSKKGHTMLHVVGGGVSVGCKGNTATTVEGGRYVLGWYMTGYSNSHTYLHLITDLWAGGSPHNNNEYIMGGFHIHGHQYAGGQSVSRERIYFHNWSGSYPGYSNSNGGNWSPGNTVYTHSTGYVALRLLTGAYRGYIIDLIQHAWYPTRDITVTSATYSNSTTL